jgi:hypothetical protein
MNGRKSKRKGANYEREVAKILNRAFNTNTIRRTPSSGALGIKGDLCQLEGNFDLPGTLSKFTWECKNQEKLSIWAALRQASQEATGGKIPLVVFTKNHERNYIALELEDFIGLLQQLERKKDE